MHVHEKAVRPLQDLSMRVSCASVGNDAMIPGQIHGADSLMATRPSPATARRQLGDKLRVLREQGGRTSAQVARAVGWSESKISRIETGRTVRVSPGDLDLLCQTYGVDRAIRDELLGLATQANRLPRPRGTSGWLGIRDDALPDPYEELIRYEQDASAIFTYEALLVPGLLQTDEYARAIIAADSALHEPEIIDQRVAARLARQAVLTRQPAPPELTFILDEAVLRRPVGGADVMHRQIRRLVAAGERPNVSVRVVPFRVGAYRGLSGPFVLLDVPAAPAGTLVYAEGMTGGVLRSKPDDVVKYRDALGAISELALSPRDSAEFLAAAADTVADFDRPQ
jgi:transcriptional regulator with XRE-family HTH domain